MQKLYGTYPKRWLSNLGRGMENEASVQPVSHEGPSMTKTSSRDTGGCCVQAQFEEVGDGTVASREGTSTKI